MVNYRRHYVPGGTYFFTVNLLNRRSFLLTVHIGELREAFRSVRAEQPFELEAIVVLPEHVHVLMALPPGDDRYSHRWRMIKSRFTRALLELGVDVSKNRRGAMISGSTVFGSTRFGMKGI